jgi:hypothetical protein
LMVTASGSLKLPFPLATAQLASEPSSSFTGQIETVLFPTLTM